MTTTYESIDPSSTPGTVYTGIHHTPEHDIENAEAAVPANRDYLTPTEAGDISAAQTSSPVTSTYESTGPLDPTHDGAYTPLQIPEHDFENAEAAVPVIRDYLIPTQTGDLSTAQTSSPMASAYESVGPLDPAAGDGTYTPLQIPEHDSENADAAVPVNRDYLIPTQTGDLSTAQTSSPMASTYESVGPLPPAGDRTYTPLQIPRNDYEEAP